MKERLSKIITSEGLNPTLLANELGVQRSGVTHILNGRNKPGFDFLQKLLERFPKLNAEWLILGKEPMYKTNESLRDLFTPQPAVEKAPPSPTLPEKPSTPIKQHSASVETEKKIVAEEPPLVKSQKTIEKMTILYSDKTFAMYLPEGL